MELKHWLLLGIIVLLIGFGILLFSDNKNRKQATRPYEERSFGSKTLSQLPVGETIIVVGFIEHNPLVQFVSEFQKEMRDTEGECFELLDAQNLKLQKGKTYEVLRADAEGTVFFGQVALFITADYVCG